MQYINMNQQFLSETHCNGILLRLTVRSNVKPNCGNNLSESLHVFLFRVLAKFCYSVVSDDLSYPIGYSLD